MFMAKIINKTDKVRLSEMAYKQYEIADKELAKLSELSSVPWGMITDEYFDKAVRVTLAEGVVYGLLLAAGIYTGCKLVVKAKRNSD